MDSVPAPDFVNHMVLEAGCGHVDTFRTVQGVGRCVVIAVYDHSGRTVRAFTGPRAHQVAEKALDLLGEGFAAGVAWAVGEGRPYIQAKLSM